MVTCTPLSRAIASIGVFDEGWEGTAGVRTRPKSGATNELEIVVGKGERVSEMGAGNGEATGRRVKGQRGRGNARTGDVDVEGVADDVVNMSKEKNAGGEDDGDVVVQVVVDGDEIQPAYQVTEATQSENKYVDELHIKNSNGWFQKTSSNNGIPTQNHDSVSSSSRSGIHGQSTESTYSSSNRNSATAAKYNVTTPANKICGRDAGGVSPNVDNCDSVNNSLPAGNHALNTEMPPNVSVGKGKQSKEAVHQKVASHKAKNGSDNIRSFTFDVRLRLVNIIFVALVSCCLYYSA